MINYLWINYITPRNGLDYTEECALEAVFNLDWTTQFHCQGYGSNLQMVII